MRGNPPELVKCFKCNKEFYKMSSGSKDISSFKFPVYMVQRYKDYNSLPIDINLCPTCCDKLDRFLMIEEDGMDYYRNIDTEGE